MTDILQNRLLLRWFRYLSSSLFLLLAAQTAFATPPPYAFPRPNPNEARAQVLFKAGNNLLEKKDFEGALSLFLQSKELLPRASNTKNAAICLLELGRYPEALAMYEDVLSHFQAELEADARVAIMAKVSELKEKILFLHIVGEEGEYEVDGEHHGSLPTHAPIYLMPGTHIVRVIRENEPDWFEQISGNGGANTTVVVPPPVAGKGFIQAFAGPVIGLSGIGFDDAVPLQSIFGYSIHARGGYRFSKGISIALEMGLLDFESVLPTVTQPLDKVQHQYEIQRRTLFFAPFMGPSLGWEKRLTKHVDFWARTGVGVMAAQSLEDIDARITNSASGTDSFAVRVAGLRIVRTAPAYASLDFGAALRFGKLTVGLSLGSRFTFVNGPRLPLLSLRPAQSTTNASDRVCPEDQLQSHVDCIPGVILSDRPVAYRPMYLFVPQIVIGFEP